MRWTKVSQLIVLISFPAYAQTNGTYLITSSNSVSPSSPTTTISIWATWAGPAGDHGFGGGNYDLTAADGLFSNANAVLGGAISFAGVISGNEVTGAAIGQLSFPHAVIQTDNPILLATYGWTAIQFTPRTVDLFTRSTNNFALIDMSTGGAVQLFPGNFTPGTGVITVVPAPAAWLVIALSCVVTRRRRRC